MTQYVEGPTKTLRALAATARYRLLQVTAAGKWDLADATDTAVAVSCREVFAADDPLAGRLLAGSEGTFYLTASEAISVGDVVNQAADGKVQQSGGTLKVGVALTAAAADGDFIEVARSFN